MFIIIGFLIITIGILLYSLADAQKRLTEYNMLISHLSGNTNICIFNSKLFGVARKFPIRSRK